MPYSLPSPSPGGPGTGPGLWPIADHAWMLPVGRLPVSRETADAHQGCGGAGPSIIRAPQSCREGCCHPAGLGGRRASGSPASAEPAPPSEQSRLHRLQEASSPEWMRAWPVSVVMDEEPGAWLVEPQGHTANRPGDPPCRVTPELG